MNELQVSALNAIAEEVHENAKAKGFHDGVCSPANVVERMAKYAAGLHGEVSELWESARKGKLFEQCNKPIQLTCDAEELADIVIRAMDMACALGVDIGRSVKIKHEYNQTRQRMHGKLA